MPTYGFKCPAGHEFDKFYRKMSDSVSELPCPTCGEPAARQLHGGAGLVFKGSGFYLTDYGKNAHRTSGDGAKPSAESATSGGEKKSSGGEKSSAPATSTPAASTPPKSSGSSGSSGAA
jgi:putative FmdB family regulatory protein